MIGRLLAWLGVLHEPRPLSDREAVARLYPPERERLSRPGGFPWR